MSYLGAFAGTLSGSCEILWPDDSEYRLRYSRRGRTEGPAARWCRSLRKKNRKPHMIDGGGVARTTLAEASSSKGSPSRTTPPRRSRASTSAIGHTHAGNQPLFSRRQQRSKTVAAKEENVEEELKAFAASVGLPYAPSITQPGLGLPMVPEVSLPSTPPTPPVPGKEANSPAAMLPRAFPGGRRPCEGC